MTYYFKIGNLSVNYLFLEVKMKRKKNLYNNMCDLDKITQTIKHVASRIRNKRRKLDLNRNSFMYATKVFKMLDDKTYTPSKPNRFTLFESKKRNIVSLRTVDKIVNNLVAKYILEPAILPCLINKNVASREKLGTAAAIEAHMDYRRKYDHNFKTYYILKADISKFFPSMNQDIVMKKLKTRIKDRDALDILSKFVYMEESGLAIGATTSQLIAIFYLNDLDHYITENLKLKDYIRYQDDFLIFSESKEKLQYALEKIKELLAKDGLKLNKKTKIMNNKGQYIFVGRKLNGSYHKRNEAKRKLNERRKQEKNGIISFGDLLSSIQCYKGLLKKYNDTKMSNRKYFRRKEIDIV